MGLTNNPGENPFQDIEEIRVKDVEQTTFSREELKDFQEVTLTNTQAEKLREGEMTIEELSALGREQLKNDIEAGDQVAENQERLNNMIREGNERQAEDSQEAEELFENGEEENNSSISDRAKEAVGEVREKAEEASDVASAFKWLENMKEKGGLMGGVASFLLAIASAFGFKKEISEGVDQASDMADEAQEEVDEAISEENIENTRQTTKDTINESLGEYITDDNRERLNSAIDGLSEEKLRIMYHRIEGGKFELSDIQEIAPEFFTEFLDEAQIDQIRKGIISKITNSLKESIKKNYGIDVDLDQEKADDLENLIKENMSLSDDRIYELKEIVENKGFEYKDLGNLTGEVIINSMNILFGIIGKGIVPVSNFTFSFVESAGNVIKIGAGALGISENITFDNFTEQINSMETDEKALLIGMLYRKGGLLMSLVGNITAEASRLAISSTTGTTVSSMDLFSSSVTNNFSRQAENIDKIARSISKNNAGGISDIMQEAIDNLDKVRDNYKIIDAVQKAEGKKSTLIGLLRDRNINISDLDLDKSFNSLVRRLGEKNNIKTTMDSKGFITSKIGFGGSADLYKLNRKLEMINNSQKRMFNPSVFRGLSKYREALNAMELSRVGDRLSFHFNSADKARDGLRRLSTLANRAPDLIKGIFDKAPIIMVAGIALNEEEKLKSLAEQVPFLIPLVGPLMIMTDSGWDRKDGIPKPVDPLNVGIGTALITVDGVMLGKSFARDGFKGMGRYMAKPFIDVLAIGRGTADFAYSVGRTAITPGAAGGLRMATRKGLERVKNIPSPRVRTLALIGVVGYIGINQMMSNGEQIDGIEEFMVDGQLNIDKVNEIAGELTDGQKEEALNYMFEEDELEGIEVKVIANRMDITSNNPDIQSDWFLDSDIFEIFKLNSDYRFTYNETANESVA